MASARRGESTTDDAMAVEIDKQSSWHFSPGIHKKEMLKRKYDDDDDDDGAFLEFSPLTGDQSRGA